MEQQLAILIADLSGYTALTETHGSFTAADIVEEFVDLAKKSLFGSAELHQVVGDEVMIISPSPNDLAVTATILIGHNSQLNYALQLHGGMHYGPILKRNNNYFGTTLNLTSRIASSAASGSIYCSAAFAEALENKKDHQLLPVGKMTFKNLSEEIDVFRLVVDTATAYYIDPVCRMLINDRATAVIGPDADILFCSEQCRDIYYRTQESKV